jgi:hypothetical protein
LLYDFRYNPYSIRNLCSFVCLSFGRVQKFGRKLDDRLTEQDIKLSRIEYALFNDGRGMEQQLKEVYKNQQIVLTDIAVLKAIKTS